VRPTPDNAQRVLQVLKQFGFASLGFTSEDLESYGMVIQLGVKPNRIDLLTAITGVSFEDAWTSRVPGELEGTPAVFIGREALISNKERTGRAKDAGDAEEL
jgi:hypothetical protein